MTNPTSQLEEQLRLALLGELTVGLAHDLRNVQNGLYLRLQQLERIAPLAPKVASLAAEMKRDVLVGVELLNRVTAFGKNAHADRPSPVDLNRLTVDACALACARVPKAGLARARIVTELGAPPTVCGLRGEIESAILNLLVNAVDAVPSTGPIVVRTGAAEEQVWVEVIDHGPGFEPDAQDHLFEPFHTTKGDRGSGLGLSSVAACARRHGGDVHVSSAPGGGATVRLCLGEFRRSN